MMDVPDNLEVPEDSTREFADSVQEVNAFLKEARTKQTEMESKVKRLGKIRANFPIHDGPNGVVLLG